MMAECLGAKDGEPCWGSIEINDWLDDGESFYGFPVHTCTGHQYMMCQTPFCAYVPESK